jgi:hypothetical protein
VHIAVEQSQYFFGEIAGLLSFRHWPSSESLFSVRGEHQRAPGRHDAGGPEQAQAEMKKEGAAPSHPLLRI